MLPPFWYRKHLEACNKRGKDQARKYSSGHGAIGRAVSTLLLSSPLIRDTGGLLVTMPSLVGGCQVLGDGWKLVEDHKPSISPCSVCLRACLRLGEPTHLHAWRTAVSLPHLCLLCSVFLFFHHAVLSLSLYLYLTLVFFVFFFIHCSCRSHRLLCDKVQLQTRSCNFVVGLNENTPLLVSFYTKLSHVSPVIHGPKGLIRLLNGRNKGGWHLRHYKYKQRWKVTKYINLSRTSILLFLSRRIILTLSPSSFIFLVKEF